MNDLERLVLSAEIKKQSLIEQIKTETQKEIELKELASNLEYLQKFVQTLADRALSQFSLCFENCVTKCLNIIFPETFIFKVETKVAYGKCNCEFKFYDYNTKEELYPMDCCGGGVLDLISFSLRLAITILKGTNEVFVLDEPFKHLSIDKVPLLCELLRSFAGKYQFIIVTHNEMLKDAADKVFNL